MVASPLPGVWVVVSISHSLYTCCPPTSLTPTLGPQASSLVVDSSDKLYKAGLP